MSKGVSNTSKIRKVTILAFDQSMELSVVLTRDLFVAASINLQKRRKGKMRASDPLVEVVSQDGEAVTTFSGSRLFPDRSIEEVEHTDLILISGIWGETTKFLNNHQRTVAWLKKQYSNGAMIGCLGSGTFLLAETGLLEGKTATIYWRMVDQFRTRYPKVILQPERQITSADNLYCSAGVSSGIELSVYLMERIWGIEAAQKVSQNFLMDIHREQPDFQLTFDDQKKHGDTQILSAQKWLELNFSSDFLLDEVADRIGLGLRSFMRRFKNATGDTPICYLQRVRIQVAKEHLRSGVLSVGEVSYRVGYEDVSFFCKLFKRLAGLTPGEYRQENYRKMSATNN